MPSILSSIKKSVNLIKKNKSLVLSILIIQILFFGILSFSASKTLVPALNNFVNIREYMDNIDLNNLDPENPLTSGMLGDDPLLIYNNAKEMIAYAISFIIIFLASFIIINGTSWYLTNKMIKKKVKLLNYLTNFLVLSIIFFILSTLILLNFSKSLVFGANILYYLLTFILFILLLAITYFSFISFTLSDKKLKEIPKATMKLGIKKAKTLIPVFLINIVTKLLLFTIIALVLELNFWLLVFVLTITLFSFVWSRLFLSVATN